MIVATLEDRAEQVGVALDWNTWRCLTRRHKDVLTIQHTVRVMRTDGAVL